jgi:hypothetical protein
LQKWKKKFKSDEDAEKNPFQTEKNDYNELMKFSEEYLNNKYPSDLRPIQISNKYWKDKITLTVGSHEFSNLVVLKGRENVMKYIKKTNRLEITKEIKTKPSWRIYSNVSF